MLILLWPKSITSCLFLMQTFNVLDTQPSDRLVLDSRVGHEHLLLWLVLSNVFLGALLIVILSLCASQRKSFHRELRAASVAVYGEFAFQSDAFSIFHRAFCSQAHRHPPWPPSPIYPACPTQISTAPRAAIPFGKRLSRRNGRITTRWTNWKRTKTIILYPSMIYSVDRLRINQQSNNWRNIWMDTIRRRIWIRHSVAYSIIWTNLATIARCCRKRLRPQSCRREKLERTAQSSSIFRMTSNWMCAKCKCLVWLFERFLIFLFLMFYLCSCFFFARFNFCCTCATTSWVVLAVEALRIHFFYWLRS